jgi:Asp-tRNA(Asn)/Glu-tRNA(Gln) amidotransferase A subunit family amidase
MSMSANFDALFAHSTLRQLSRQLAGDDDALTEPVSEAAARVNGNAGKNTYLNLQDAVAQARQLPRRFPDAANRPLLYGLPVSLKDCFDIAGTVTTAGSRYYADTNPIAAADSWIAERLYAAGAVIVGKSHMHELAWGITGENPWFGDCVQPRDASLLTGGSSSGAAASVQEGSAVAAIGTDTGGSIRAPAAFCGLCGFRASLGLGDWRGGWHLAPSFDTIGWLFRDLCDGPLLAAALFGIAPVAHEERTLRIGVLNAEFLSDCESAVMDRLESWRDAFTSRSHVLEEFATDFWQDSYATFSSIQAHEAAALHRGHYDAFAAPIPERLSWGASLTESQVAASRADHAAFLSRMDDLFTQFDYLLLPSTPVSELIAGADQSTARPRILRYMTPISLAGCPVVALPGGMQLVGPRGGDAKLLAFAATLHESDYNFDVLDLAGAGEGI